MSETIKHLIKVLHHAKPFSSMHLWLTNKWLYRYLVIHKNIKYFVLNIYILATYNESYVIAISYPSTHTCKLFCGHLISFMRFIKAYCGLITLFIYLFVTGLSTVHAMPNTARAQPSLLYLFTLTVNHLADCFSPIMF